MYYEYSLINRFVQNNHRHTYFTRLRENKSESKMSYEKHALQHIYL